MIERERRVLATWFDAFERTFGARPSLGTARETGCPTITFPYVADRFPMASTMVGDVSLFNARPHVLAHLRLLGFAWDERGLVMTVPAPWSYRAALGALGFRDHGMDVEYRVLDQPDLPVGEWFGCMTRGVQVINVGSAKFYAEKFRGARQARLRAALRGTTPELDQELAKNLMYLQHDMTRHVLLAHLIPRNALLALGARTAERSQGGYARWTADPWWITRVPSPALRFWENDFVVYCHRVWNLTEEPGDFARIFAAPWNLRQLIDVHDDRLARAVDPATAETLKTDHVPPAFRLRRTA